MIALAQYGISYAVATLGTATTSEHIQQLFRVVSEIVFCFDGDRAGKQAAWRALENALPELTDERQVKFLFLPTGEDPDTYIRKVGKIEFENAVLQALPLTRFFLIGLNKNSFISTKKIIRFIKVQRIFMSNFNINYGPFSSNCFD